jgi:hypothetical protein
MRKKYCSNPGQSLLTPFISLSIDACGIKHPQKVAVDTPPLAPALS